MVLADAVIRKLPGALGHADSAVEESFSDGARRRARVPALHAAGRLPRLGGPGGPSLRRPRPGPATGGSSEPPRGPDGRLTGQGFATIRATARARRPRGFSSAMSSIIDSIERRQLQRHPLFNAGDRVRVHFQVIEGSRRRTQVFEGIVMKRQGSGARETFTVRKQSFGVGVERTFPVHSPKIEKLEIAARGDVRRAKLYYLRGRVGKRARVAERRWGIDEEVIAAPARGRRGAGGGRRRGRRPGRGRGRRRPEAGEVRGDRGRRRGRRGGADRPSRLRKEWQRRRRSRPQAEVRPRAAEPESR